MTDRPRISFHVSEVEHGFVVSIDGDTVAGLTDDADLVAWVDAHVRRSRGVFPGAYAQDETTGDQKFPKVIQGGSQTTPKGWWPNRRG